MSRFLMIVATSSVLVLALGFSAEAKGTGSSHASHNSHMSHRDHGRRFSQRDFHYSHRWWDSRYNRYCYYCPETGYDYYLYEGYYVPVTDVE